MLGWDQNQLSLRANVALVVVERAEAANSAPTVTLSQAAQLQQAFERAGVRFGKGGGAMRLSGGREP